MIAAPAGWDNGMDPSKQSGAEISRVKANSEMPVPAEDPQEGVGDFIARQVLEKDSIFFEG